MIRPFLLSLALCLSLGTPVFAAGGGIKPPQQDWPHAGIYGTFDRAALQRGFQVYKNICAACHSMDLVSYRNLQEIGFSELEVKAIANEYSVMDGPNDEGEMFERPARPSDKFVNPYPNEQAARSVNGGAYPPDLSLLAKARAGGEDYIYALLTGYPDHLPEGVEPQEGRHYNTYFEGHWLAMAPPLQEGLLSYDDGTAATPEQMARDVSQFLTWAAEPKLELRKRMGAKVMIFLAILAMILYAYKRKIWADVKH